MHRRAERHLERSLEHALSNNSNSFEIVAGTKTSRHYSHLVGTATELEVSATDRHLDSSNSRDNRRRYYIHVWVVTSVDAEAVIPNCIGTYVNIRCQCYGHLGAAMSVIALGATQETTRVTVDHHPRTGQDRPHLHSREALPAQRVLPPVGATQTHSGTRGRATGFCRTNHLARGHSRFFYRETPASFRDEDPDRFSSG